MTELISAALGVMLLVLKAWFTGKMDEAAYLAAVKRQYDAEEKFFGADVRAQLDEIRARQTDEQKLQDALDKEAGSGHAP